MQWGRQFGSRAVDGNTGWWRDCDYCRLSPDVAASMMFACSGPTLWQQTMNQHHYWFGLTTISSFFSLCRNSFKCSLRFGIKLLNLFASRVLVFPHKPGIYLLNDPDEYAIHCMHDSQAYMHLEAMSAPALGRALCLAWQALMHLMHASTPSTNTPSL